ncbi:MAG TPA: YbaK/EbsC family protein [Dehalococcoidia bacterium]|nr:YbaK/EbsC family protein [Dehalococcoidia bacterium]
MTTFPASAQRFADAARELGLDIEVREFPEGTRTAEDAARAIGCDVAQIVKSLVFLADADPIICLTSGVNRVDTARLAATPNAVDISRADAEAVRAATGFAVGGVPPFGHATPVRLYCDRDLLSHEIVWAAAGTPTAVFAVSPARLIEATKAHAIDLKEEA